MRESAFRPIASVASVKFRPGGAKFFFTIKSPHPFGQGLGFGSDWFRVD